MLTVLKVITTRALALSRVRTVGDVPPCVFHAAFALWQVEAESTGFSHATYG